MSGSPADMGQQNTSYKAKSEVKPASLLRPENPFNKSLQKPLIVSSSEESSPLLVDRNSNSNKKTQNGNTAFKPFDPPVTEKKSSIFDRLDNGGPLS